MYITLKRTIIIIVFCLFSVPFFGQIQTLDTTSFKALEEMGTSLKMPIQNLSDGLVDIPVVPRGYHLRLKGSDNLSTVNAKGEVGRPIIDQEVKLFFTLRELATGNQVEVTHLTIDIPAIKKLQPKGNAKPMVIPSLREWVGGSGRLPFKSKGNITVSSAASESFLDRANQFAEDLNTMFGYEYNIKISDQPGDIHFSWSDDKSLNEEGYLMSIDNNVSIEGLTPEALFWGTRSILQMLYQNETELTKGVARDYPKYAMRAFMLDCGRKFIRYEFLQDYLKIMSFYKMNEFHVHLNDNAFVQFFDNDWDKTYSGFRLESEYFPGLASKDGFYTKDEFRQLQLDGMDLGVNVIPEIDVPAHSLAFTHYRKSLGSDKYGMDHLDIQKPETYQFLDSLFFEYLGGDNPVFVGPDVHVGTDEYSKTEAEHFRSFIDHYLRYVKSFGKRPRFWGSLSHAAGQTPVLVEDVIMNVWYNGYSCPREAIDMGYQVTSIPDGLLYIVPAAGYYYDYLNLPRLYDKWEPNVIGKEIFAEGHPSIEGGSFAVWNDHAGNGISEKDIHHRAFPAMQLLAEKMWTGKSEETFDDYSKLSQILPEAPGVNILGKVESKSDVVLHYDFSNKKVEDLSGNGYDIVAREGNVIETPIEEIGYNYSASFTFSNTGAPKDSSVFFESDHAKVFLTSGEKYQIGFKRENYRYLFSPEFDRNKIYNVRIEGDNKGTSIYLDNKLEERLEGKTRTVKRAAGSESNSMMYIQETLVFPLRYIGGKNGDFVGEIKEIKIKR